MNTAHDESSIYFQQKIDAIKFCLNVRPIEDKHLKELVQKTDEFMLEMKFCKDILIKTRDSMAEAKKMLKNLNEMKSVIIHAEENIPKCLLQDSSSNKENEDQTYVLQQSKSQSFSNDCNSVQPEVAVNQSSMKKCLKTPVTKINPLTIEEFETIPKYLKGRIQYNKINNVINEINATISAKYKILKTSKKNLSQIELNDFRRFKTQECEETKRSVFCVADDFVHFSNLKMDKVTLNIINILRHCRRIREVRGPNKLVRFVLL